MQWCILRERKESSEVAIDVTTTAAGLEGKRTI